MKTNCTSNVTIVVGTFFYLLMSMMMVETLNPPEENMQHKSKPGNAFHTVWKMGRMVMTVQTCLFPHKHLLVILLHLRAVLSPLMSTIPEGKKRLLVRKRTPMKKVIMMNICLPHARRQWR